MISELVNQLTEQGIQVNQRELYSLADDPWESNNLIEEKQDVFSEYQRLVDNFILAGRQDAASTDHMLELSEAVRQIALLAVPMKPLCRLDCAGLCPYCGANLNRGKCQCASCSQKSPWVDLEKLITNQKRR